MLSKTTVKLARRFLLPAFIVASALMSSAQKLVPIFNAADTSGWYVYTSKFGKGNDPQKVFQFTDSGIHVSGEDFAYIITKKKYGSFHLIVEFKWGEKKYPPRENAKRDGGILYHTNIYNGDKIWPRSLEYQIQEGDCGDFWMTDSTTILHSDTLTTATNNFRVIKIKDAEKPNGQWNFAEVIVKDGFIIHLLNKQVVNKAKLGNTTTGNIVLQSEGAELYYRNIRITTY
jgi:hypothetical protein